MEGSTHTSEIHQNLHGHDWSHHSARALLAQEEPSAQRSIQSASFAAAKKNCHRMHVPRLNQSVYPSALP
jgi:hypothetical protein